MNSNQKKYLIIGGAILLLVAGYLLIGGQKQTKTDDKEPFPTEMAIPTIDSSVKVILTDNGSGQEVILKVGNLPEGTESVDYELAYNTAAQGLQGVIGTIGADGGQSDFEKEITLGTCSSGKCVYHQVVGKIKLNLRFNGDYGEKVFEKEYEI